MQLSPILRKATELGIGFTAIATLILAGCGGGGGSSGGGNSSVSTVTTTITPFKGMFKSGMVSLKDVNGNLVTLVSGGSINSNGTASVTYPANVAYPLTVEVTGTFLDETSGVGATGTISAGAPLRGLIPAVADAQAASGVPVTVLTEFARTMLPSSGFSAASAVAAITDAASSVIGVASYSQAMLPPVFNAQGQTSDQVTLKLAALAHVINQQGSGANISAKLQNIATQLAAGSAVNAVIPQIAFNNALGVVNGGASSLLPVGVTPPTIPAFTLPGGSLGGAITAGGGGGGVTTCASLHYSVPVHAPTATELAVYAKTYTGNVGNFGPNIGDPFVSTGSATFVLSAAGGLTYNGTTKQVTSMCLENTPTTGAPLYVEMQPQQFDHDHVDLFADGGFTGVIANGASLNVVRGGSCMTTCGSGSTGGTTPTITGFSPSTGAVGTTVTITGTNLGLGFPPAPMVKFGATATSAPVLTGQTSLTVSVPAGLAAGSHTITVGGASGTPMTVGTFTVTAATGGGGTVTSVAGLLGGAIQGTALNIADNAGVVSSLVGNSTGGFADGTGTAASFSGPSGITTDGSNLYVADTSNHNIRKVVIATGAVMTLAGSGTLGFTDGTGTAASFNRPTGITTDGSNLYVADQQNHRIRKIVISTGEVSTLAGSGTRGWAVGIGTAATFDSPTGITTDGSNLYVADSSNNRIRKIVIVTGAVSTLAGGGTRGLADGTGAAASFSGPGGITTDGTNLYVADSSNNRIRKIVIASGAVTTLAGSGYGFLDDIGTAAAFRLPIGITTDGINLYVADSSNNRIRKIVIASGTVTTLAGSGVGAPGFGSFADGIGTAASFYAPNGITTDGLSLYVTDYGNNRIRKIQ